ncbi:hypothetical protein E1A91_D04G145800v1, partial [Gossypium mustelinum]
WAIGCGAKIIQHFTHCHPLMKVSANIEFLCDGCRTLGFGTRYRCEPCDSDLHDHYANFPLEISSFKHQMCLFYRCKLCEFDAHTLCTQLPEYVQHVMHTDNP